MKSFSFNPHMHVSLTHACILAAIAEGLSVSVSGHGIQKELQSKGGYLHFEERREEGKFDVFQNNVLLGDFKIVGMYIDFHGRVMSLDDFITKFSQQSVEDVVKEFVTEAVAKLQSGENHVGSTIYDRALVAELWKYVKEGF